MTEANKVNVATYQTHHRGVVTILLAMLVKLLLISLLGWLVLTMWFFANAIFRDANLIVQEMESLTTYYHHYINHHSFHYLAILLSYFDKVKIVISSNEAYLLSILAKFSRHYHYDISSLFQLIEFGLSVLVIMIKVTFLRLMILLFILPLWVALLIIAMIDGLGQRDIRKFSGARESTFLFHRIKLLISASIIFPLTVYMCLPFAVNPGWFLFPMVLISSGLVMFVIRSYKKYG